MITSNFELLQAMMDGIFSEKNLFMTFQDYGYKGDRDGMYMHLIHAFEEASIFTTGYADDEEEYFNTIVQKMNELL